MLTSGVLPLALRALHLVGAILWVGGVAFVGIMALAAAPAEIDSQKLARVARIGVLAEMFPDAKFVHIARDPNEVYSSTERLWRATFDSHDAADALARVL